MVNIRHTESCTPLFVIQHHRHGHTGDIEALHVGNDSFTQRAEAFVLDFFQGTVTIHENLTGMNMLTPIVRRFRRMNSPKQPSISSGLHVHKQKIGILGTVFV